MLKILYEDNHLIAVNKPPGLLVHGDRTGDKTLADTVKKYIKDKYKKSGDVFLGVIHRLDRPASGAILFARTSKGLERMNRLFAERKIEKTYWAVTGVRPDPYKGTLEHYISKDHKKNKAKAYNSPKKAKDAKLARLEYELIGGLGEQFLVEIKLHTGRPHQIRVQLAKIGCPIRGDHKYGFKRHNYDGSIHLHSREMSFVHPVKKEPVTITAKLPNEQIWNLFRGIKDG